MGMATRTSGAVDLSAMVILYNLAPLNRQSMLGSDQALTFALRKVKQVLVASGCKSFSLGDTAVVCEQTVASGGAHIDHDPLIFHMRPGHENDEVDSPARVALDVGQSKQLVKGGRRGGAE